MGAEKTATEIYKNQTGGCMNVKLNKWFFIIVGNVRTGSAMPIIQRMKKSFNKIASLTKFFHINEIEYNQINQQLVDRINHKALVKNMERILKFLNKALSTTLYYTLLR